MHQKLPRVGSKRTTVKLSLRTASIFEAPKASSMRFVQGMSDQGLLTVCKREATLIFPWYPTSHTSANPEVGQ